MNSLTKKTKPISQLLKPTSKTLYISLFSTSSTSYLSHYNQSSSVSSRRHDEESRNVRVSVWWDIENCGVPNGVNVFKIAHSITSAVRLNGIKGPIQITAFGDVFCLNRANQEALSSTGVNLIHIPNGGKNSADRSLLVDLMYWVSQNPPPAHIFLISGDRDFAGILHRLRMNNYNILLAAREAKQSSGVLYSSASIMWYWNELVKGENLPGKHFNQPPDGPYNSWYGHYRGPLEDPFAIFDQQKYFEVKESSNVKQSSDARIRPVPMAILRLLRRLLNSHAEGLTITELRDHLIKNKVNIDKDFYGHKKFSRFLMALPRIVKVESRADGQFFLQPASTTSPETVESNDVSAQVTVNGNRDVQVTAKANHEIPTITRMVDVNEKPAEDTSVKKLVPKKNSLKEKPADVFVQPMTVNGNKDGKVTAKANRETPTITRMEDFNEKVAAEAFVKKLDWKNGSVEEKPAEEIIETKMLDADIVESPMMTPTKEHNSKPEKGLFRKLWTKLFPRSIDAEQIGIDTPDKLSTSSVIPEKLASEKLPSKSSIQDELHDPALSSSDTAADHVAKVDTIEKSEASPGLITKMINWCKFWKNDTAINKPIELPIQESSPIEEDMWTIDDPTHSKKLDNDAPEPIMHELFTKDTFWSALRSFLRTNRGSNIVFNSQSREQIAERLQKEGPLFLQPLQVIDIRNLVDLLVSDKKWIKEYPTQNPCFRLVSRYEENSGSSSVPAQPHNPPTGLSSIFFNSDSHDNPQIRVSSVGHKKPSEKSRTEILSDCQKLLDEALSQNPDGLNIGLFKKQFLERYGYALDHQKIGYPKLVNLLQMMPGVKVESTRVFPDNVVYAPGIQSFGTKEKSTGSSDSEMSDSARKDDESESPWEELGPVEKSNVSKEEGEYESSVLEDDEFSEEEGEERSTSSFPVKVEDQRKSGVDEEESSLLRILDTWYSTKDENPRDHGSDPEGSPGSAVDEPSSLGSYTVDVKGETASTVNNGRKHKSKTYTFVAEGTETKKGILIDGILGSLKKSGEAKVQG